MLLRRQRGCTYSGCNAQVIKNAFAMRSNLGDPGVCGVEQQPGSGLCFQDMENLTSATLSPGYADSLKCAPHCSSDFLACA